MGELSPSLKSVNSRVSLLHIHVVMNLHDPGLLQTLGFSTGFTNVQCQILLSVWLQFELVCDDLRKSADDASTTFSLLL